VDGETGLNPSEVTSPRLRIKISAAEDGQWRVLARHGADDVSMLVPAPALRVTNEPDLDSVRETGSLLHSAIFAGEISALLELARFRAADSPLAIELEASSEIADLPWEWLFDPETERFLSLSNRATLSRWITSDNIHPPETPALRTLQVSVQADVVDEEVLSLVRAIGADPAVEVHVETVARRTAQVVIALSDVPIPPTAKLVIVAKTPGRAILSDLPPVILSEVEGSSSKNRTSEQSQIPRQARNDGGVARNDGVVNAPSVVVLPANMLASGQSIFLTELAKSLAHGALVDVAVTGARRKVAEEAAIENLAWAVPKLYLRQSPGPLVKTTSRTANVKSTVLDHTVGWVTDSLSGILISVAVFLAGLILYRVGFSSSKQGFELDILSPISLYDSFKSLVIELSTYDRWLLLGICAALLLVTVMSAVMWFRKQQFDPEERANPLVRFGGPLGSGRTLSILSIGSLTILGAFLYQQYLWHIHLPIDKEHLGIAITKASAAEDFDDLLAERLVADDSTAVVRTLPLDLDASDIDRGRTIAAQIGATAVVIAREESNASFVGYVVFEEASDSPVLPDDLAAVVTAAGIDATESPVAEHPVTRVLHADTSAHLAEAIAGVVAYERGDYDHAVVHLQAAVASEPTSPNSAVANFYLASAVEQIGAPEQAADAYLNAVAGFEETGEAGKLGPVDELLLVKSYLALGEIDATAGRHDEAITRYQQAVGHRLSLLARYEDLPNPSEFRVTYAEVYGRLAAVYKTKGIAEEERYWQRRFEEELALIDS
jgi:tetratricopeptide (TPR) repeat protein